MLPPRQGDVRDSQASVEKARDTLGFQAAVPFEEGIRRTVDFFRRLR
jgi:nucleoside-diphosphate-sugar epimerase